MDQHLTTHQLEEDLTVHWVTSLAMIAIQRYSYGACKGTHIVDLWDTDKPAKGLNGTGPDNYEETLFSECLMSVINNYDPSTSLFLY